MIDETIARHAAADKSLSESAEDVVQLLVSLGAPGCPYLHLTESDCAS